MWPAGLADLGAMVEGGARASMIAVVGEVRRTPPSHHHHVTLGWGEIAAGRPVQSTRALVAPGSAAVGKISRGSNTQVKKEIGR
jgi:hypothetical protein